MFVNAGANFVVPDFVNVTQNGGDLLGMADQVRRASRGLQECKSFGGDPERFYISGHRRAGIGRACCSPPTGRRTSACR